MPWHLKATETMAASVTRGSDPRQLRAIPQMEALMFQDMASSNAISLDGARAGQRPPVLGLIEDCRDSLREGRAMPDRD